MTTVSHPPPKVFISHASEDKDRFVLGFAEKCHSNSIECWLDYWEMKPGDSLVDKISSGLDESDIFTIVLSNNSVNKPWVKTELNSAIIGRIQKQTKIIPIVLDDCEIPTLLKELKYIKIKDFCSYENEFIEFKNSVFNISIKPPVKPLAPDLQQKIMFSNLNQMDNFVIKTACELALQHNSTFIQPYQLSPKLENILSSKEIKLALEYLDEQKYIETVKFYGPDIPAFNLLNHTFLVFLQNNYQGFKNIFNQICVFVSAEGNSQSNLSIATHFNVPHILAKSILIYLENKGLITTQELTGNIKFITSVSISFKRQMQNL